MTAPSVIGRYEVIRELGRGAMGTVYLARDTALGRLVALKTFRVPLHEDLDLEDSGVRRRRALREAQRAGTLSHPNVITIYDLVESPGEDSFYIVMEYVEGQGLDARIRAEGPMPLADVAPLIAQIASALDHLHARGIVHRDVKPGNVLVAEDGRVKITDFGIARSDDPAHTLETEVYGTPYYMAPEQIQGKPVDARTDVFALGVVLYELLTGCRPFPGATVAEVAHRIVYAESEEPQAAGRPLAPALREVLGRALATEPADRFPTAGALAAALWDIAEATGSLDPEATTAFPRRGWAVRADPQRAALPRTPLVMAAVAALLALLLGSGVAYVHWLRGTPPSAPNGELEARRVGYVKLMSEGRRLLTSGDPGTAAGMFRAAEGLSIDPAGAAHMRQQAESAAAEQGAQTQLLDARAEREKAAAVLAEVRAELAKVRAAAAWRRPVAPIVAPTPEPTATVDFGVLHIELQSEAPEGILTLWVDGREVARHTFDFYERSGLFHKKPVPGSWTSDLTLAPGRHPVRVLVVRPGEAGQVAELEAPVEAGALRVLAITLPSSGEPVVVLR